MEPENEQTKAEAFESKKHTKEFRPYIYLSQLLHIENLLN